MCYPSIVLVVLDDIRVGLGLNRSGVTISGGHSVGMSALSGLFVSVYSVFRVEFRFHSLMI